MFIAALRYILLACVMLVFPPSATNAFAQAEMPNLAGKTVRIIIGFGVGGEYGLYSQLVASHIGKHVPGKPTVVVQEMPGAGGVQSLNYLAKIAPRDGTTLTLAPVPIVQDGLFNPAAQFDPASFQWIGRLAGLVQAGVVWSKSGVTTLEDAKSKILVAGGGGLAPPTLNPLIMNEFLGTKFKVVTGYKGTAEVAIAWEKGEVDMLTTSWDTISLRYGEKIRSGEARPLYVYSMAPVRELPSTQSIATLGRNEQENAFLQIYTVGTAIGRSLAAPPGMASELVGMWRQAFDKMIEDKDFRAATEKGGIRLDPMSGERIDGMVKSAMAQSPSNIKSAKQIYEKLTASLR